MRISNKLSTPDFIQLQKALMESYKPKPAIQFMLKYVVNFLYSFVVFLGLYYIMKTSGIDNWIIPALAGIGMFVGLFVFYPKIYKSRLNKAIEKFYGKQVINVERDLDIDETGISVDDHKGEVKHHDWSAFDRIIRDAKNVYLKFKDQDEGFIVQTQYLTPEEYDQLFGYLNNLNKEIEVR
ncbi:MAG: hypothetical protein QMB63_00205 [Clostridiaceae bacterium]